MYATVGAGSCLRYVDARAHVAAAPSTSGVRSFLSSSSFERKKKTASFQRFAPLRRHRCRPNPLVRAAPSSSEPGCTGEEGDGTNIDSQDNTSSPSDNSGGASASGERSSPSGPQPETEREREGNPPAREGPPKAAALPPSLPAYDPNIDAVSPGIPAEDESFALRKKRLELIIEEKEWGLDAGGRGDSRGELVIEYVAAVDAYKELCSAQVQRTVRACYSRILILVYGSGFWPPIAFRPFGYVRVCPHPKGMTHNPSPTVHNLQPITHNP